MCVKTEKITWHGMDFEGEIDGRSERKTKTLNSEGAKEKNEFKEDRQNAALNRWKEKKCMVSLHGKCLRQLTKIRPGSGLGKVT